MVGFGLQCQSIFSCYLCIFGVVTAAAAAVFTISRAYTDELE